MASKGALFRWKNSPQLKKTKETLQLIVLLQGIEESRPIFTCYIHVLYIHLSGLSMLDWENCWCSNWPSLLGLHDPVSTPLHCIPQFW
uniref:Uncharacterized protein n=1 Tax=Romanomermis culicivorax TaxID=13658 RepID=A0A915IS39_ROMCU